MDSIEVTDAMTTPEGEDPKRGLRGAWLAAAVFVAALAVVGALVAFAGSGSDDVADESPPSSVVPSTTDAPTTTPPTTEVEGLTEAEALAVADAYFAAFAAGDLDAIMDLLAADAEFGSGIPRYGSRRDFELAHVWNIAQQTTFVDVECRVAGQGTAGRSLVHCTYGNRDYVQRAVGAPPVGLQISMLVAPGGQITSLERIFTSSTTFNAVGVPFDLWMLENYPDAQDTAGCCWGETVEESIARGEAVMVYADLWAAYLEENGCVWDEPCEP